MPACRVSGTRELDSLEGDLEEEGVEEDAMLTMAVDGVMNKIYE